MTQNLFELADQLGQALIQRKLTIAVAESCTGGGICQTLTAVPGSSAWFDRGYVTYSNRAKMEMLAVAPESLDQSGAVSRVVALEMVDGALGDSGAGLALAVTGIAGPGGGTAEKPVGTVFIAWRLRDRPADCQRFHFSGNREEVRRQTIKTGLLGCLKQFSETSDT